MTPSEAKAAIVLMMSIIAHSAFGQKPCGKGYKYVYWIATQDAITIVDTCLIDSLADRLNKETRIAFCEGHDSGSMELGEETKYHTPLSHFYHQYWSDSLNRCITTEEWQKKISGKWVSIEKREYDKIILSRKSKRR